MPLREGDIQFKVNITLAEREMLREHARLRGISHREQLSELIRDVICPEIKEARSVV